MSEWLQRRIDLQRRDLEFRAQNAVGVIVNVKELSDAELQRIIENHKAQRESFARHNVSTGDPRLD